MTDSSRVLVSVVVPTYERSDQLIRTLQALSAVKQPQGGSEVIVVDDGSGAEHVARIQQAVAAHSGARLLRQPNGGPSAARNMGIAHARGQLIVFLDDDCMPTPEWLLALTRPLLDSDERLAAVGGRVVAAPPRNWVQRFCMAIEYATGVQGTFENASTQNACYRRSVLMHIGTFDVGFRHPGGDDPDLSTRATRAGYRLQYVPEAVVQHEELASYWDFLLHMYYRGLGEARIGWKFGRRRRVLARLALWPLFLGKIGVVGWKRTRSKGSLRQRIVWSALEQIGYAAFLAGTAQGLVRRE